MVAKKGKVKQRDSENMFDEMRERVEEVFLAGLGAFSNAQMAGEKRFDMLVKEGEKFRKKTTKQTEDLIDDIQKGIREMRDDAQAKADDFLKQVRGKSSVESFNEVFDKRVAATMDRLHMPMKKDIDAINRKLTHIEKILKEKPVEAAKPAPPKATTAAKPKTATTSKPKTPVKKTAPKKAA